MNPEPPVTKLDVALIGEIVFSGHPPPSVSRSPSIASRVTFAPLSVGDPSGLVERARGRLGVSVGRLRTGLGEQGEGQRPAPAEPAPFVGGAARHLDRLLDPAEAEQGFRAHAPAPGFHLAAGPHRVAVDALGFLDRLQRRRVVADPHLGSRRGW